MFERFTESARRALFFARADVSTLGADSIRPEHLLLGVLKDSRDSLASEVCKRAGVSYKDVRSELESDASGPHLPTSVEIPFDRASKRVLEHAVEEADRLSHSYIGTEHLLLALLRDTDTRAGAILAAHGLTIGVMRDDIVHMLDQGGARHSGKVSDPNMVRERLGRLAAMVEGRPEALALIAEIAAALDDLAQGPGHN